MKYDDICIIIYFCTNVNAISKSFTAAKKRILNTIMNQYQFRKNTKKPKV